MNSEFWTKEIPVYKLFEYLIEKGKYKNLDILLSDSIEEIVNKLMVFRGEWQRNCH